MWIKKKKGKKIAIGVISCCLTIGSFFMGRHLISNAGNMEIKVGSLTITVPDNMLCADVSSSLNVRISPNTNGDIIAKLYPGDAVEFVEESGDWSKINLEGQIGYVSTKYTIRGTALKKYIKKHMDKFVMEGTITSDSFVPAFKKKEQVGKETASYTMEGKINQKATVYASKSSNSKMANGVEQVERCAIAVDGLRFREKAGTNSKIITVLYRGNYVDVISDKDSEWLKVKHNGEIGYVSKQYTKMVQVKEPKSNLLGTLNKEDQVEVSNLWKNWVQISYQKKTAYVKRSAVEVNAKLDKENKNIEFLAENNTKCCVLDVVDRVAYIRNMDNKKGYIDVSFVKAKVDFSEIKIDKEAVKKATDKMINQQNTANNTLATNVGTVNGAKIEKKRQEIVAYAKQFIGNKYKWGGNSLTDGTDCSGFTQQVFLHFGISLYRCSYEQVKNGNEVSFEQLKPGDLIFYYKEDLGRIGHVALYTGNGKVVHAKSRRSGIVEDNWNYMTPYKAVSVLK